MVYIVERQTKPMTSSESTETHIRASRISTHMRASGISSITEYYINKRISNSNSDNNINKKNFSIIEGLINKNSKNNNSWIVTRLKNNYNNLDSDVKELLDYTTVLLKIVSNLESSLSRVKREYNELQSSLMSFKRRVRSAEERAEQATSCLPAENICCVCMTKPRECAYIGCGHFSACSDCCARMGEHCPICRTNSPFIKIIVS